MRIDLNMSSEMLSALDRATRRLKATEEGRKARREGRKIDANPYPEDEERHWNWLDCWSQDSLRNV
jgi:hypothetical protein